MPRWPRRECPREPPSVGLLADLRGPVLAAPLRGGPVMPAMTIGDWAKKTGRKWHLVESIIAGDAITHCGRRINEDQVSSVMPLTRMIGQPQLCKQCDRPVSFEDDGSTHDELVP